jgi:hypothetical protein
MQGNFEVQLPGGQAKTQNSARHLLLAGDQDTTPAWLCPQSNSYNAVALTPSMVCNRAASDAAAQGDTSREGASPRSTDHECQV